MVNKKIFPFATILAICLAAMACSESAAMQLADGTVPASDSDAAQTETNNSTPKGNATSHSSITKAFLDTMRTPVGFSMGFFELYAPNLLGSQGDSSATYTMMRPRLFASTRTKRSEFQLDYSFGYRQYNRHREVHSDEQSASLSYSYQLSRNSFLRISDEFRSTFNDLSFLSVSASPVLYQPSFTQALYLPRQRSTTNSVQSSLTYRAGKRSNVTLFTSYDLWHYGDATFGDSRGVQAGIRGDFQINKWLFLASSYSHYLNKLPGAFQATQIHRLQVGGFKFKPRRTVEFYVSGGVDSTRFRDRQRTTASYEAGISKQSGATLLSLVYHRGLSIAIGPDGTLNGHTVSASLSQWLSHRVNIQTTSAYTRGTSFSKGTRLDYLGSNAELEVVLQRHLLYSVQYSYVSQRGTGLPETNLQLARYTVTTGFQLVLPSLGGRERRTRQPN